MDSGGGLYWFANRNYIIGVANYGIFCAAKYPSVNLRVDKYFGMRNSLKTILNLIFDFLQLLSKTT